MQNAATRTRGVVSLDLCADQAVLSLLPKSRIAAVSPEVASDPAFALPHARNIARVRPRIEDILALRPSLVVRSYGGGVGIDAVLKSAGVRVVQLGYAQSLADVVPQIEKLADTMDARARGKTLADDFTLRLSAISQPGSLQKMLYVTPGNVTTGPDTFVGQMIAAAGFRTYSDRSGWPNLPIEDMQIDPPAFVARGFFDSALHRQDAWTISRHPALSTALSRVRRIDVPGGWLACGNHLSINAIEKMAAARGPE